MQQATHKFQLSEGVNPLELAEKYEGRVHIQKVNVDKMPQLAQKFGVRSIPALFLVQDKKIVQKALGYQSPRQLTKMLDHHLSNIKTTA